MKELAYCFLFVSAATVKNPYGGPSSCVSGSIEFSYEAQTNEYRGTYDLTMKNKGVRRGEFRAQFCKSKEPVKKWLGAVKRNMRFELSQ